MKCVLLTISIQPNLINIGPTCPPVVDVVLACVAGATHVRCIEVEESTAAERFCGPTVIDAM